MSVEKSIKVEDDDIHEFKDINEDIDVNLEKVIEKRRKVESMNPSIEQLNNRPRNGKKLQNNSVNNSIVVKKKKLSNVTNQGVRNFESPYKLNGLQPQV